MKNTSRLSLVTLMLMSLLNISAVVSFAGEIKKTDFKKPPSSASFMDMEIKGAYGAVEYKEVITEENRKRNINLETQSKDGY